jgi:hypothetical protein
MALDGAIIIQHFWGNIFVMQHTPGNFSIEHLLEEAAEIRPANRLFRIYPHSPTLFELLLLLENQLSVTSDLNHVTPDDETWTDLLKNIKVLCQSHTNADSREYISFYLGQIAMLLDCIRSRDAHAHNPNLVRLFI